MSGINSWMVVGVYWTKTFYDHQHQQVSPDDHNNPIARDLQSILAHELDHLNGNDHLLDPTLNGGRDPWRTSLQHQCGELP